MAEFQLSEKDYLRASWLISRRRLGRILLLAPVAIALIVISQSVHGESWVRSLLFCLVIIVAVAAMIFFLTTRRLKRAYREQESMRQRFTVTINNEELVYSWA